MSFIILNYNQSKYYVSDCKDVFFYKNVYFNITKNDEFTKNRVINNFLVSTGPKYFFLFSNSKIIYINELCNYTKTIITINTNGYVCLWKKNKKKQYNLISKFQFLHNDKPIDSILSVKNIENCYIIFTQKTTYVSFHLEFSHVTSIEGKTMSFNREDFQYLTDDIMFFYSNHKIMFLTKNIINSNTMQKCYDKYYIIDTIENVSCYTLKVTCDNWNLFIGYEDGTFGVQHDLIQSQ
jgi:hypothetical protein